MEHTSFNSMHLIELKKDLQILSKDSAGYSIKRFFNAVGPLSNWRRINPFWQCVYVL